MVIRVAVARATGKLGSIVCDLVADDPELELTGAVVSSGGGHEGESIHGVAAVGPDGLDRVLKDCDVYVDLTSPEATEATIGRASDSGAGIVLGTTSVRGEALEEMARNIRKRGSSAVVSANFSIGVNVFWKVCETMAGYLPDYDIEVVEMHHGDKKDAPSGTAAEAIRRLQKATGIEKVVYGRKGAAGPRQREIGVHRSAAGTS